MTLEQTIQDMYDNFPTLFKERADCLNHLFCTIGNGYEWENGELVDGLEIEPDMLEKLESEFVDGKAFQHHKYSLRDDYLANDIIADKFLNPTDDFHRNIDNRIIEILSKPNDIYYNVSERYKRWDFYCQGYTDFPAIFNIPDDIKLDWALGIEECKNLLFEDGYDLITAVNTALNTEERIKNTKTQYYNNINIRKSITNEQIEEYKNLKLPIYL